MSAKISRQTAIAGMRAVLRIRTVLAVAIVPVFALALRAAPARATTYTVNTLDDSNGNSDCSLRDAINAADGTPTTGSTCNTKGTGSDTIQFSVTGTIALTSTLPEVTDSQLTISGPASPGITVDGGGFGGVQVMQAASGATLSLDQLTISNGSSSTDPGGAIVNHGTLSVTNSTFSGNITRSGVGFSPVDGGAIFSDGMLTITNSSFSGNSALCEAELPPFGNECFFGGSGGAISSSGTLIVMNSTFSTNDDFADVRLAGGGGAILSSGTLNVTNSTFSGNSAIHGGDGGAISGGGTIINSTFAGNRPLAGGNGGVGAAIEGSATLKNTIVSGTVAFNSPAPNCAGQITDAGYNISDDDSCNFTATGSLNSKDPGLSSDGLTNNGGPTQTIALAPGSPAIDAIPVADCTDQSSPPKPITTDQRGMPRPDFQELVCDIGAYEAQETFAGQLRKANCHGKSVSALSNQYGSIDAAASALGFPSVQALQNAIKAFCGR